jgi:methylmalonyl-CoA mutase, N-terminal domain
MKQRQSRRKPMLRPAVQAHGSSDLDSSSSDGFGAGIFDEPEPTPEPEITPEPVVEPVVEPEPVEVEPEPTPVVEEVAPDEAPAEPKPRRSRPERKVAPKIPAATQAWIEKAYAPTVAKHPERKDVFSNTSGIPLAPIHIPESAATESFEKTVGWPGEFPYTRGIQPSMYRGRLWTMRQYAGFTSARATNERFHYLLKQGQTGLSVAFDLPTQIGYDSDDAMSEGEVGKVGVPINSLHDMEVLLEGIPLDEVSTSMTINATAPILLAMYLAVAKKQGVPYDKVRGTLQNDILKEFAARGTYRFPISTSLGIVTEVLRFCSANVPQWNPISISGYHMREAGCTAAQEIAFTLANGVAYVESSKEAGLDVDSFGGRLSFFFAAHNDLFEEVAKFRAARRMWAKLMTGRLGAKEPRSARLRFHTQTAGSTLTSQQSENNVVRVTLQALAAVLGGTQSLHTNSRDEALGLPTEDSARCALRTQQIIAHESGVADVIDPLGGSPYVEALTDEIESKATAIMAQIDEQGGAVEAIRKGWIQDEIHRAAYKHQQALEQGEAVVVGVNKHQVDEEVTPPVFRSDPEALQAHLADLAAFREKRDGGAAEAALAELEIGAAWGNEDLLPQIIRCVEAYCTVGEICKSLENIYGKYVEGEESAS